MIPFNLPHNPKPSPAIRKPNPLRAGGPYYHICYVRCAISNLRPPNCFYNMSPSYTPAFSPPGVSHLFLRRFLHPLNVRQATTGSFLFLFRLFPLFAIQLDSHVRRDDKFHSTNRAVFRNTISLSPQGRVIINTLRLRSSSIPSSFLLRSPADYESNNKTKSSCKSAIYYSHFGWYSIYVHLLIV